MESTERRSTTELPKHADIRTCWDKVKPGIVDILKDNPLLTFIPEDVYSECVNERAFLYTSSVGFLVLTVEVDTFTKDKTLLKQDRYYIICVKKDLLDLVSSKDLWKRMDIK